MPVGSVSLAQLLGEMTAGETLSQNVSGVLSVQMEAAQDVLAKALQSETGCENGCDGTHFETLEAIPIACLRNAAERAQEQLASGTFRWGRPLHDLPDAVGLFYEEKIDAAARLLQFTEDWYQEFLFKRWQLSEGCITPQVYDSWHQQRFNFYCAVRNRIQKNLRGEKSTFITHILSSAGQLAQLISSLNAARITSGKSASEGWDDALGFYGCNYALSLAKGELALHVLREWAKVAEIRFEEDVLVIAPSTESSAVEGMEASLRIYFRVLGWEALETEDPAGEERRFRTYLQMHAAVREAREAMRQGRLEYIQRFDQETDRTSFARWAVTEGETLQGYIKEVAKLRSRLPREVWRDSRLYYEVKRLIHDEAAGLTNIIGWGELFLNNEKEEYWNHLKNFAEAFRPHGLHVAGYFERLFRFHRGDADQWNVILSVLDGEKTLFHPRVDQEALGTVLNNLVSNGIKYRRNSERSSRVTVVIKAEKDQIVIEDNGIGMDPAFAVRLGKQSLREERATGIPGTGTGWRLIHRTLHRLGYTYSVNTRTEEGTTVTIQLKKGDLLKQGSET